MGVNVRATAMFREACTFPFCVHCIFLVLSEPHYLLLLHDIFGFTTMPSFVAPRYLRMHRDAHLLKRHDIFGFTTMPSFEAPRYL
jgi:hypothetical protein